MLLYYCYYYYYSLLAPEGEVRWPLGCGAQHLGLHRSLAEGRRLPRYPDPEAAAGFTRSPHRFMLDRHLLEQLGHGAATSCSTNSNHSTPQGDVTKSNARIWSTLSRSIFESQHLLGSKCRESQPHFVFCSGGKTHLLIWHLYARKWHEQCVHRRQPRFEKMSSIECSNLSKPRC